MDIVEALLKTRELADRCGNDAAATYLLEFLDERRGEYVVLQHLVRGRFDLSNPENLGALWELAWDAYGAGEGDKVEESEGGRDSGLQDDFSYVRAIDAEVQSQRVEYEEFLGTGRPQDASEDDEIAEWLGVPGNARSEHSGADEKKEDHGLLSDPEAIASSPIAAQEELEDLEEDVCAEDDLSLFCGAGWQRTSSAFDSSWEALVLDADDFEVQPIREDLSAEVDEDGSLEPEKRALHMALDVGIQFKLELDEVSRLTDIFIESGWGATKSSIVEALASGVSVDELWMAWEVKTCWSEHPEFSMSAETLVKFPSFADRQTSSKYRSISWPAAIRIVRAFPGVQDLEEIQFFLEESFEHWYWHPELWGAFRAFLYYVDYRIGRQAGSLEIWPGFLFDDCSEEQEWGWVNGGTGATTPEYQFLEKMGLLPAARFYPYAGLTLKNGSEGSRKQKSRRGDSESVGGELGREVERTGYVSAGRNNDDHARVIIVGNRIIHKEKEGVR